MLSVDFYMKLNYDLSYLNGDPELDGLTLSGFKGSKPFVLDDFNELELKAAIDTIKCHFHTRLKNYNKSVTSYDIKHLIESDLSKKTDKKINYISNGTLILAMIHLDFAFKRIEGTPNCYFKISQKDVNKLFHLVNK